jgi:hypothetical protein
MPVSSVSEQLSTALYFSSVFILMIVAMMPVTSLYRDSNQLAAQRLASGIATQVGALVPGMTSEIEFGSSPGMNVSVRLSGSEVVATVNGLTSASSTSWRMDSVVLSPYRQYSIQLSGGVVIVA